MVTRREDNSTFRAKLALRSQVVARVDAPVVIETHGGFGKLGAVAYADVTGGVVIERDERKAEVLARARPTWSVYCGRSEYALAAGAGAHIAANILDVDPWGDPWPTIFAFTGSRRPRARVLYIVVHDGLPQSAKRHSAWRSSTLAPFVRRYGAALHARYMGICRELMDDAAARANYQVTGFSGRLVSATLAHYVARLERTQEGQA